MDTEGITRRDLLALGAFAAGAVALPASAGLADEAPISAALALDSEITFGSCTVKVPSSWQVNKYDGSPYTFFVDPNSTFEINFSHSDFGSSADPASFEERYGAATSGSSVDGYQYRTVSYRADGVSGEAAAIASFSAEGYGVFYEFLLMRCTDKRSTAMSCKAKSPTDLLMGMFTALDVWNSMEYDESYEAPDSLAPDPTTGLLYLDNSLLLSVVEGCNEYERGEKSASDLSGEVNTVWEFFSERDFDDPDLAESYLVAAIVLNNLRLSLDSGYDNEIKEAIEQVKLFAETGKVR